MAGNGITFDGKALSYTKDGITFSVDFSTGAVSASSSAGATSVDKNNITGIVNTPGGSSATLTYNLVENSVNSSVTIDAGAFSATIKKNETANTITGLTFTLGGEVTFAGKKFGAGVYVEILPTGNPRNPVLQFSTGLEATAFGNWAPDFLKVSGSLDRPGILRGIGFGGYLSIFEKRFRDLDAASGDQSSLQFQPDLILAVSDPSLADKLAELAIPIASTIVAGDDPAAIVQAGENYAARANLVAEWQKNLAALAALEGNVYAAYDNTTDAVVVVTNNGVVTINADGSGSRFVQLDEQNTKQTDFDRSGSTTRTIETNITVGNNIVTIIESIKDGGGNTLQSEISTKNFNADGSLRDEIITTYNADDQLVSDITLDSDGVKTSGTTYAYDDNGDLSTVTTATYNYWEQPLLQTTYDADGVKTKEVTTTYNPYGILSRIAGSIFGTDGTKQSFITEYNPDGTENKGSSILTHKEDADVAGALNKTADFLSLISAIRSGEPLPIISSGMNISRDVIDMANGNPSFLNGPIAVAGAASSILNLGNAIEEGDGLGMAYGGAQLVGYTAQAFAAVTEGAKRFASLKICDDRTLQHPPAEYRCPSQVGVLQALQPARTT